MNHSGSSRALCANGGSKNLAPENAGPNNIVRCDSVLHSHNMKQIFVLTNTNAADMEQP